MTDQVWISGAQDTVLDLMRRRLDADPDSQYLDINGSTFSAGEVAETAARIANALISFGVRPGDRVASLIENSPEAMLTWWGVLTAGAVAVPINTAYKGEYLRHQLVDSGARVLIVAAELADRAIKIAETTPELNHVVVVGEPVAIDGVTVHTWADLLGADDKDPGI